MEQRFAEAIHLRILGDVDERVSGAPSLIRRTGWHDRHNGYFPVLADSTNADPFRLDERFDVMVKRALPEELNRVSDGLTVQMCVRTELPATASERVSVSPRSLRMENCGMPPLMEPW